MESRPLNTQILTSSEIAAVIRATRKMLGPVLGAQLRRYEGAVVESIRFQAVRSQCIIARERRGLTIKQASAALRVPQYRIKAVETGSMRDVQGDVLRRYMALLELDDEWMRVWARANRTLAVKLGLNDLLRRENSRSRSMPSNRPLRLPGAARNGRGSSRGRRSRGARS
jgi:hypothetical protein